MSEQLPDIRGEQVDPGFFEPDEPETIRTHDASSWSRALWEQLRDVMSNERGLAIIERFRHDLAEAAAEEISLTEHGKPGCCEDVAEIIKKVEVFRTQADRTL